METRSSRIATVLRQRVMAGLHLGSLSAGRRLPSVRDLADEFHADPRVVLAAYRELATEGLVCVRARSGVFVDAQPRKGSELLTEVAQWMLDDFLRGLSRGILPTELRRQARACLDTVRVRAACIECNDDQLYALCSAISGYGLDTSPIDLDKRSGPGVLRALARAEVLVTTRFHVAEVQRMARRLRRPVIVAALHPAFLEEIRRMLAEGPVWYVCTDPRFAAKLPRIFPGLTHTIRPVILGRDRLDLLPREAHVYAMPSARERLPRSFRPARLSGGAPVFSPETARALLSFVLQRNLKAARQRGRTLSRLSGEGRG